MLRKFIIAILAGTALLACTALPVFAQVGELRGHVVMVQADGTKAPAADVIIDVFRTDIAGKYNAKTNKKGEFVFAGVPYVGTYTVAASHPTAQPNWLPGVKAGRDVDYEITLSPGNGKRLTLDEIKAATGPPVAGAGGTKPAAETAAARAAREELEKKNKEIEEKNQKIGTSNEIVARTFKAGNEALDLKNYDEALKQYDEGIAADPDQPALLTRKTVALKARGVDRYNAAITSKDDAAKASGLEAAKSDFRAAADTATKARAVIQAAPVPVDAAQYNMNKLAVLGTRAEAMRLFITKVDATKADEGQAAFEEYIAAETDPVKKAKAQHDLAQMLFDANAFDKSLAEYKKILGVTPDDTDALVKSGMLLFNIGAMSNDKSKYQEAANYLQQFVDKAPDTDKLKADAKAILDELKNQQNVKAEKTAAPVRRRRP
ncbi:MAG: carboxypeptidase regulatory-like domain-containing protein [Acidobacteriota bacterium]